MNAQTAIIRSLNDQLRRDFSSGVAVMTPGVAALGADAAERIFRTIAHYDDFHHANDPWEEHDMGMFEAEGEKIMFKIDYFSKDMTMHSPDPANPAVTTRVITILLSSEY